jgi:hypothetical protein
LRKSVRADEDLLGGQYPVLGLYQPTSAVGAELLDRTVLEERDPAAGGYLRQAADEFQWMNSLAECMAPAAVIAAATRQLCSRRRIMQLNRLAPRGPLTAALFDNTHGFARVGGLEPSALERVTGDVIAAHEIE